MKFRISVLKQLIKLYSHITIIFNDFNSHWTILDTGHINSVTNTCPFFKSHHKPESSFFYKMLPTIHKQLYMYYGGSTYGRKHKIFFLGLDTFGHNIIVSSYTQSPANNVTFFTFLAENSSHVVDTTYFSSPLSSLVGHQHLALT